MAKVATRVAYGDALKELMVENKNVVVLDADLAGSTKSGEAKKQTLLVTLTWELPKEI